MLRLINCLAITGACAAFVLHLANKPENMTCGYPYISLHPNGIAKMDADCVVFGLFKLKKLYGTSIDATSLMQLRNRLEAQHGVR